MSDDYEANDNVASLDETRYGPVKRYGNSKRAAKKPFPLQVGDSPVVVVHEPDAGLIMEIEEAQSTRKILRLFLGDDYGKVEEHLEAVYGDELVDIARDLSRHFGLFDTQNSVNRAERRRSKRG